MNSIPPSPRNAPLAIWSLVLSLLGLACCSICTAIPGVICGHKALGQIKRSAGALTGEGLAWGGMITGYICIALSILMIPYLAAIAVPNFVRAREMAIRNACTLNLQTIDHAKQMWALESKKSGTDVPTESDLRPYLKENRLPVCPGGGTYTLNAVDAPATCSKHGAIGR